MSYKKRWQKIIWRKITRPWYPKSTFGAHTMIEYQSNGTKVCADCQYTESLYVEIK